jgi:cytochrome c oxidase assembly protein subunit 15
MKILRQMVSLAIVLAMIVIALGAYTRLTDAGLGCPDWPGCYGLLQIPQQHHAEHAAALFPQRPLETHKARNEMVHRYFAGTLGLLIAVIFGYSWYLYRRPQLYPVVLSLLVVLQAALGMWTVTLNLQPVIVMGHLLGGFSLLTLLWWYRQQLSAPPADIVQSSGALRRLGTAAVIVLGLQISLGGWTSANYAALSCVELPVCHNGWQRQLNFSEAFDLHLGHDNYEYGVMSKEARQTVHVSHRFGAALTTLVLGWFCWCLWQQVAWRGYARLIAGLLLLQVTLGVVNVVALLPLLNAVAHNFVAVHLLVVTVLARRQLSLGNIAAPAASYTSERRFA